MCSIAPRDSKQSLSSTAMQTHLHAHKSLLMEESAKGQEQQHGPQPLPVGGGKGKEPLATQEFEHNIDENTKKPDRNKDPSKKGSYPSMKAKEQKKTRG